MSNWLGVGLKLYYLTSSWPHDWEIISKKIIYVFRSQMPYKDQNIYIDDIILSESEAHNYLTVTAEKIYAYFYSFSI